MVAALGLGRHAMVAGELEVVTATYPLRERLWGLRALALTRSGRQADALEVLRRVRDLLADELGLKPGAELRALQTAVLRQDPALEWSPPQQPTAAQSPDSRQGSEPPRTQTRTTEAAWPLVGAPLVTLWWSTGGLLDGPSSRLLCPPGFVLVVLWKGRNQGGIPAP